MTNSTTKKPAELESLRADIDRSDEAIVGALRTRLGAVRRIAEVKRLQGLPVYDAVREASLLYKLRSMAGSDVEGVALPVYRTMMAAARRFEAQVRRRAKPSPAPSPCVCEAPPTSPPSRKSSPCTTTCLKASPGSIPSSCSPPRSPCPPPWSATCASTASASRHRTSERVQPERIRRGRQETIRRPF